MAFVAGQTLTAAQLNDLDIDSLVVDTNVLVVDKTNNRVGIGETSPSATLHVNAAAANTTAVFESTDAQAYIGLKDNGSGSDLHVAVAAISNDLVLRAGNSNAVRVKDDGKVGVGTQSPAGEFELTANTPEMIFSSSPNKTNRYRFDANFTDSADFGFSTSYWNGSAYVRAITLLDNGRVGINTTSPSTTLDVNGSLSKSSGSFRIPHPLPAKAETHDLVHSFVEAPQADNLYRGRADLTDGAATVDLDAAAGMTTGTFPLLNRNVQCFIVNNDGWTAVRGSVSGSILTIEAQDATCADTVDWLVVGERHDQHMFDTGWTDDDGRVIVEPERPPAPEPNLEVDDSEEDSEEDSEGD